MLTRRELLFLKSMAAAGAFVGRPFDLASFFGSAAMAQETDELLARGTYLMESIGACGNCHTPKRSDGTPIENLHLGGAFVIEEPAFRAYAPNITMDEATGIGTWSDEEIIRAIREGFRPDGTIIGPPMPTPWYRDISDTDVRAIVAYLRNAPPVNRVVPTSEYRVPLPPDWGPLSNRFPMCLPTTPWPTARTLPSPWDIAPSAIRLWWKACTTSAASDWAATASRTFLGSGLR